MVSAPSVPAWLATEYPFSPRSFQTPHGARMSYVDEGPRSDEAVVMLHGNPTWSFYYRHLVRALSPQVRCIVPDHIGMGLSEKPENYAYRLATRIADVEALLASLDIKKIHLVVHDWGGAIGFGVATRQPARVGRIVILNTAAFVSDDIPFRISLCRAPGFGRVLVRGFNGFAGPAVVMAMHARKLSRTESRGYLLPYDSWANRVAVHQFVRDIPLESDHPSRTTLAQIERDLPSLASNPKLIVWGGRDFCFHDGFLAQFRKVYPTAEVRHLPNAGHYVLDDAPHAEALIPIANFLRA